MFWRNIIAVVAGVFAGGCAVMLVESISMILHPLPPDLDLNDQAAMVAWIKSLPLSAKAIVVIAWGLGALVATAVARWTSLNRASRPALISGLFFLAAVIFNLSTIPHPFWMWPIGILVSGLGFLLGYALAGPKNYEATNAIRIKASPERVFQTLARPELFRQAIPEITNIEILSQQNYGIGTKVRETRSMNGRTASVDMEIRDQVENQRIQWDSIAGGSRWSTQFSLLPAGKDIDVQMNLIATPKSFFVHLLAPILLGVVVAAIKKDLERVRDYCERSTSSKASPNEP